MIIPHRFIGYEARCWQARVGAVAGVVASVEKDSENSFELALDHAFRYSRPPVGGESYPVQDQTIFVRKDLLTQEGDQFYCDQEAFNPCIVSLVPREISICGQFPWPLELRIDQGKNTWVCPVSAKMPTYIEFKHEQPVLCSPEHAEVSVQAESAKLLIEHRSTRQIKIEWGEEITYKQWQFRACVANRIVTDVPRSVVDLLSELTTGGSYKFDQQYYYL